MVREKGLIPPEHLRKLRAADRRAAVAAAELRAAVLAAHLAGGSVRELGEALGRSPTTIQAWLKTAREEVATAAAAGEA